MPEGNDLRQTPPMTPGDGVVLPSAADPRPVRNGVYYGKGGRMPAGSDFRKTRPLLPREGVVINPDPPPRVPKPVIHNRNADVDPHTPGNQLPASDPYGLVARILHGSDVAAAARGYNDRWAPTFDPDRSLPTPPPPDAGQLRGRPGHQQVNVGSGMWVALSDADAQKVKAANDAIARDHRARPKYRDPYDFHLEQSRSDLLDRIAVVPPGGLPAQQQPVPTAERGLTNRKTLDNTNTVDVRERLEPKQRARWDDVATRTRKPDGSGENPLIGKNPHLPVDRTRPDGGSGMEIGERGLRDDQLGFIQDGQRGLAPMAPGSDPRRGPLGRGELGVNGLPATLPDDIRTTLGMHPGDPLSGAEVDWILDRLDNPHSTRPAPPPELRAHSIACPSPRGRCNDLENLPPKKAPERTPRPEPTRKQAEGEHEEFKRYTAALLVHGRGSEVTRTDAQVAAKWFQQKLGNNPSKADLALLPQDLIEKWQLKDRPRSLTPEEVELAVNGPSDDTKTRLDAGDELLAAGDDGLERKPANEGEEEVYGKAWEQWLRTRPKNDHRYQGTEAELTLGEFRRRCTGDVGTPCDYRISEAIRNRAIYGSDGASASGAAASSPYIGRAAAQVQPRSRMRPIDPKRTTYLDLARESLRKKGVTAPSEAALEKEAERWVNADPVRNDTKSTVYIDKAIGSRTIPVPVDSKEVDGYELATLQQAARDNATKLTDRDTFKDTPEPASGTLERVQWWIDHKGEKAARAQYPDNPIEKAVPNEKTHGWDQVWTTPEEYYRDLREHGEQYVKNRYSISDLPRGGPTPATPIEKAVIGVGNFGNWVGQRSGRLPSSLPIPVGHNETVNVAVRDFNPGIDLAKTAGGLPKMLGTAANGLLMDVQYTVKHDLAQLTQGKKFVTRRLGDNEVTEVDGSPVTVFDASGTPHQIDPGRLPGESDTEAYARKHPIFGAFRQEAETQVGVLTNDPSLLSSRRNPDSDHNGHLDEGWADAPASRLLGLSMFAFPLKPLKPLRIAVRGAVAPVRFAARRVARVTGALTERAARRTIGGLKVARSEPSVPATTLARRGPSVAEQGGRLREQGGRPAEQGSEPTRLSGHHGRDAVDVDRAPAIDVAADRLATVRAAHQHADAGMSLRQIAKRMQIDKRQAQALLGKRRVLPRSVPGAVWYGIRHPLRGTGWVLRDALRVADRGVPQVARNVRRGARILRNRVRHSRSFTPHRSEPRQVRRQQARLRREVLRAQRAQDAPAPLSATLRTTRLGRAVAHARLAWTFARERWAENERASKARWRQYARGGTLERTDSRSASERFVSAVARRLPTSESAVGRTLEAFGWRIVQLWPVGPKLRGARARAFIDELNQRSGDWTLSEPVLRVAHRNGRPVPLPREMFERLARSIDEILERQLADAELSEAMTGSAAADIGGARARGQGREPRARARAGDQAPEFWQRRRTHQAATSSSRPSGRPAQGHARPASRRQGAPSLPERTKAQRPQGGKHRAAWDEGRTTARESRRVWDEASKRAKHDHRDAREAHRAAKDAFVEAFGSDAKLGRQAWEELERVAKQTREDARTKPVADRPDGEKTVVDWAMSNFRESRPDASRIPDEQLRDAVGTLLDGLERRERVALFNKMLWGMRLAGRLKDPAQLKADLARYEQALADLQARIPIEVTKAPTKSEVDARIEAYGERFQAELDALRMRYWDGESLEQLLPEVYALVTHGTELVTGKRLFTEQIIAGWGAHHQYVDNMSTGSGKTYTAMLWGTLNAIRGHSIDGVPLAGRGTFIVTRSTDLATENKAAMEPTFRLLGNTLEVIDEAMSPEAAAAALNAHVTLGHSTTFAHHAQGLAAQGLDLADTRHFGRTLVDEIDEVLVLDAASPPIVATEADALTPAQQAPYLVAARVARFLKEETRGGRGDYVRRGFGGDGLPTYRLTAAGRVRAVQRATEHASGWTRDRIAKHRELFEHGVEQALTAKHLESGRDYLVRDGEVVIIVHSNGTAAPGRRWQHGQHSAVEAKEQLGGQNVQIRSESSTVIRWTFPHYFSRFDRVAGMSGTARAAWKELKQMPGYHFRGLLKVPSHFFTNRVDLPTRWYAHPETLELAEELLRTDTIRDTKTRSDKGQPVQIRVDSPLEAMMLVELLERAGVKKVQRIDASLTDEQAAAAVAKIGDEGQVTVSDNRPTRGTDHTLDPAAKEAGGLHVGSTGQSINEIVDQQLGGRAGRKDDPGSFQPSDVINRYAPPSRVRWHVRRQYEQAMKVKGEVEAMPPSLQRYLRGQRKRMQRDARLQRKSVLRYEDVALRQAERMHELRRRLIARNPDAVVEAELAGLARTLVDPYLSGRRRTWDLDGLQTRLHEVYEPGTDVRAHADSGLSRGEIVDRIHNDLYAAYVVRRVELGRSELRNAVARALDAQWREQLRTLGEVRYDYAARRDRHPVTAPISGRRAYTRAANRRFRQSARGFGEPLLTDLLEGTGRTAPFRFDLAAAGKWFDDDVAIKAEPNSGQLDLEKFDQIVRSERELEIHGLTATQVRRVAELGRQFEVLDPKTAADWAAATELHDLIPQRARAWYEHKPELTPAARSHMPDSPVAYIARALLDAPVKAPAAAAAEAMELVRAERSGARRAAGTLAAWLGFTPNLPIYEIFPDWAAELQRIDRIAAAEHNVPAPYTPKGWQALEPEERVAEFMSRRLIHAKAELGAATEAWEAAHGPMAEELDRRREAAEIEVRQHEFDLAELTAEAQKLDQRAAEIRRRADEIERRAAAALPGIRHFLRGDLPRLRQEADNRSAEAESVRERRDELDGSASSWRLRARHLRLKEEAHKRRGGGVDARLFRAHHQQAHAERRYEWALRLSLRAVAREIETTRANRDWAMATLRNFVWRLRLQPWQRDRIVAGRTGREWLSLVRREAARANGRLRRLLDDVGAGRPASVGAAARHAWKPTAAGVQRARVALQRAQDGYLTSVTEALELETRAANLEARVDELGPLWRALADVGATHAARTLSAEIFTLLDEAMALRVQAVRLAPEVGELAASRRAVLEHARELYRLERVRDDDARFPDTELPLPTTWSIDANSLDAEFWLAAFRRHSVPLGDFGLPNGFRFLSSDLVTTANRVGSLAPARAPGRGAGPTVRDLTSGIPTASGRAHTRSQLERAGIETVPQLLLARTTGDLTELVGSVAAWEIERALHVRGMLPSTRTVIGFARTVTAHAREGSYPSRHNQPLIVALSALLLAGMALAGGARPRTSRLEDTSVPGEKLADTETDTESSQLLLERGRGPPAPVTPENASQPLSRKDTGLIYVDENTNSATLLPDAGWTAFESEEVTRSTVATEMATDGWQFAPGSVWTPTDQPNRFSRPVVRTAVAPNGTSLLGRPAADRPSFLRRAHTWLRRGRAAAPEDSTRSPSAAPLLGFALQHDPVNVHDGAWSPVAIVTTVVVGAAVAAAVVIARRVARARARRWIAALLRFRTGRVVLDYTNTSATVIPDDGGTHYIYAPGVTRANVEERIAADGWRFRLGSSWALTRLPDGRWRKVVQRRSRAPMLGGLRRLVPRSRRHKSFVILVGGLVGAALVARDAMPSLQARHAAAIATPLALYALFKPRLWRLELALERAVAKRDKSLAERIRTQVDEYAIDGWGEVVRLHVEVEAARDGGATLARLSDRRDQAMLRALADSGRGPEGMLAALGNAFGEWAAVRGLRDAEAATRGLLRESAAERPADEPETDTQRLLRQLEEELEARYAELADIFEERFLVLARMLADEAMSPLRGWDGVLAATKAMRAVEAARARRETLEDLVPRHVAIDARLRVSRYQRLDLDAIAADIAAWIDFSAAIQPLALDQHVADNGYLPTGDRLTVLRGHRDGELESLAHDRRFAKRHPVIARLLAKTHGGRVQLALVPELSPHPRPVVITVVAVTVVVAVVYGIVRVARTRRGARVLVAAALVIGPVTSGAASGGDHGVAALPVVSARARRAGRESGDPLDGLVDRVAGAAGIEPADLEPAARARLRGLGSEVLEEAVEDPEFAGKIVASATARPTAEPARRTPRSGIEHPPVEGMWIPLPRPRSTFGAGEDERFVYGFGGAGGNARAYFALLEHLDRGLLPTTMERVWLGDPLLRGPHHGRILAHLLTLQPLFASRELTQLVRTVNDVLERDDREFFARMGGLEDPPRMETQVLAGLAERALVLARSDRPGFSAPEPRSFGERVLEYGEETWQRIGLEGEGVLPSDALLDRLQRQLQRRNTQFEMPYLHTRDHDVVAFAGMPGAPWSSVGSLDEATTALRWVARELPGVRVVLAGGGSAPTIHRLAMRDSQSAMAQPVAVRFSEGKIDGDLALLLEPGFVYLLQPGMIGVAAPVPAGTSLGEYDWRPSYVVIDRGEQHGTLAAVFRRFGYDREAAAEDLWEAGLANEVKRLFPEREDGGWPRAAWPIAAGVLPGFSVEQRLVMVATVLGVAAAAYGLARAARTRRGAAVLVVGAMVIALGQQAAATAPGTGAVTRTVSARRRPGGSPRFDLVVSGYRFPVDRPRLVIGRDTDADVVLVDRAIALRHLEVFARDGFLTVVAMAPDGFGVDDLERTWEADVRGGQTIRVGNMAIEVRDRAPALRLSQFQERAASDLMAWPLTRVSGRDDPLVVAHFMDGLLLSHEDPSRVDAVVAATRLQSYFSELAPDWIESGAAQGPMAMIDGSLTIPVGWPIAYVRPLLQRAGDDRLMPRPAGVFQRRVTEEQRATVAAGLIGTFVAGAHHAARLDGRHVFAVRDWPYQVVNDPVAAGEAPTDTLVALIANPRLPYHDLDPYALNTLIHLGALRAAEHREALKRLLERAPADLRVGAQMRIDWLMDASRQGIAPAMRWRLRTARASAAAASVEPADREERSGTDLPRLTADDPPASDADGEHTGARPRAPSPLVAVAAWPDAETLGAISTVAVLIVFAGGLVAVIWVSRHDQRVEDAMHDLLRLAKLDRSDLLRPAQNALWSLRARDVRTLRRLSAGDRVQLLRLAQTAWKQGRTPAEIEVTLKRFVLDRAAEAGPRALRSAGRRTSGPNWPLGTALLHLADALRDRAPLEPEPARPPGPLARALRALAKRLQRPHGVVIVSGLLVTAPLLAHYGASPLSIASVAAIVWPFVLSRHDREQLLEALGRLDRVTAVARDRAGKRERVRLGGLVRRLETRSQHWLELWRLRGTAIDGTPDYHRLAYRAVADADRALGTRADAALDDEAAEIGRAIWGAAERAARELRDAQWALDDLLRNGGHDDIALRPLAIMRLEAAKAGFAPALRAIGALAGSRFERLAEHWLDRPDTDLDRVHALVGLGEALRRDRLNGRGHPDDVLANVQDNLRRLAAESGPPRREVVETLRVADVLIDRRRSLDLANAVRRRGLRALVPFLRDLQEDLDGSAAGDWRAEASRTVASLLATIEARPSWGGRLTGLAAVVALVAAPLTADQPLERHAIVSTAEPASRRRDRREAAIGRIAREIHDVLAPVLGDEAAAMLGPEVVARLNDFPVAEAREGEPAATAVEQLSVHIAEVLERLDPDLRRDVAAVVAVPERVEESEELRALIIRAARAALDELEPGVTIVDQKAGGLLVASLITDSTGDGISWPLLHGGLGPRDVVVGSDAAFERAHRAATESGIAGDVGRPIVAAELLSEQADLPAFIAFRATDLRLVLEGLEFQVLPVEWWEQEIAHARAAAAGGSTEAYPRASRRVLRAATAVRSATSLEHRAAGPQPDPLALARRFATQAMLLRWGAGLLTAVDPAMAMRVLTEAEQLDFVAQRASGAGGALVRSDLSSRAPARAELLLRAVLNAQGRVLRRQSTVRLWPARRPGTSPRSSERWRHRARRTAASSWSRGARWHGPTPSVRSPAQCRTCSTSSWPRPASRSRARMRSGTTRGTSWSGCGSLPTRQGRATSSCSVWRPYGDCCAPPVGSSISRRRRRHPPRPTRHRSLVCWTPSSVSPAHGRRSSWRSATFSRTRGTGAATARSRVGTTRRSRTSAARTARWSTSSATRSCTTSARWAPRTPNRRRSASSYGGSTPSATTPKPTKPARAGAWATSSRT